MLTSQFLHSFESNLKFLQRESYTAYDQNLIWRSIATERQSEGREERLAWFLETAKIEKSLSKFTGSVRFRDMATQMTVLEHVASDDGLRIHRNDLEDVDGIGVSYATEWAKQAGSQAAYFPQRSVADAILNPGNSYDGVPFFSTAHPVNPLDASAGTYSNNFTGGSALPIDTSVTVDVALNNISRLMAFVASIKCANGRELRRLRITKILAAPLLYPRLVQLLNAEYVAQAAASGGGSGDVRALVKSFKIAEVIQMDELAGAVGGSDTTWYAIAQPPGGELGPFVYSNRQPYEISYYNHLTDAQLARMDFLEWIIRGRNGVQPGHPYLMFRCLAA